jgi:phosphoribosyl 1,2-cyclic phosphate phosphodiesterase
MKITFLGTGAAEFYPGAWCGCEYCRYARERGGRNIRFTSSVHFADKCLIDFPADVFNKALQYHIDLLPTELLLYTHSHEDHFYPRLLHWRYRHYDSGKTPGEGMYNFPCARFTDLPHLSVYGNRKVFRKLEEIFLDRELADYAMDFCIPECYREYHSKGVDFIPMIANHNDTDGERGLIYLVSAQGRTFLYATDSGAYIDRTRDCIRAHKVDAVIMEATFGNRNISEGHMTLDRARAEADFFRENNVFTGEPRIILTHMSPHRCPPYDMLAEMLRGTCMESAWDGMVLEL